MRAGAPRGGPVSFADGAADSSARFAPLASPSRAGYCPVFTVVKARVTVRWPRAS